MASQRQPRPCKFGAGCTRGDCWFSHPQGRAIEPWLTPRFAGLEHQPIWVPPPQQPPQQQQFHPQSPNTTVPGKLSLYYFDLAGKAECIRLACTYGKVDWSDVRVTREEFADLKAKGELEFGQLPAAKVEGSDVTLVQTASILRFVGRLSSRGIYPVDSPLVAAVVDSICDQEADMFSGLRVSKYQERFGFGSLGGHTSEGTMAVRKAINDDVLPRHFAFLESLLAKSDSGWLAGTPGPTIADFYIVCSLQWFEAGPFDGVDHKTVLADRFPALKALMGRLMALPEVVEYYSTK